MKISGMNHLIASGEVGGGGRGGINDMIWQLVLEKFNMIPFWVQFYSRFCVVLSFVPLSEGSFGA